MFGLEDTGSELEGGEVQRSFGNTLRRTRVSRGLSQEGLAQLAGVHRTYVSSVERGERNPSLVNIARFARALNVQPGELMPVFPLEAQDGA